MRKFFFLSIILILVWAESSYAQNRSKIVIEKSKIQLNAGTGFYSGGFPIYAFAGFHVHPDWTVGPQVHFVFYDNFSFILSGRVDYHFNRLLKIPDNLDFYAGATMGIDFSRRTSSECGNWWWNLL